MGETQSDSGSGRGPGEPRDPLALRWRGSVGSTQDEARALLGTRTPPFAVASDHQRAGRGRLSRRWETPRGQGLALTVAARLRTPQDRWGWLSPAVGLAVLTGLEAAWPALAPTSGTRCLGLKWPNDILALPGVNPELPGGKLAGILLEPVGGGVVLIGVGLNLSAPRTADGVVPGAAWLHGPGGVLGVPAALASGETREPVASECAASGARDLAARLAEGILAMLGRLDEAAGVAADAGIATRYAESCVTLGGAVRVDLVLDGSAARGGASAGSGTQDVSPARRPCVEGLAVGLDAEGSLLVRTAEGTVRPIATGEVHHLRPGPRRFGEDRDGDPDPTR